MWVYMGYDFTGGRYLWSWEIASKLHHLCMLAMAVVMHFETMQWFKVAYVQLTVKLCASVFPPCCATADHPT